MATEVLVPPLGQTVDSVRLVHWHLSEGQSVKQGEMLFAIETDKATLDIEAPASGVLRNVAAQPGDEVRVLTAIALIAEPGEVVKPGQIKKEPDTASSISARGRSDARRPESAARRSTDRIFISPRARRLADDHNIPLTVLEPTGPEESIIERDVRRYLRARAKAETLPVPLMVEPTALSSATAPSVTLNVEADATALVQLRHTLAEDGLAVSTNDLLLFVLARALHEHPQLNASLEGGATRIWEQINIGLAVGSGPELVVPVIRNVDRKGLSQLATESRALAERVAAGKCTPSELRDGTFTLADLGMFGIDAFTPVINLPQCATLGVGRFKKQQAFVGGQIVSQYVVWLSLAFDRRLVNGATAARFLQRIAQLVEQPYLLLA